MHTKKRRVIAEWQSIAEVAEQCKRHPSTVRRQTLLLEEKHRVELLRNRAKPGAQKRYEVNVTLLRQLSDSFLRNVDATESELEERIDALETKIEFWLEKGRRDGLLRRLAILVALDESIRRSATFEELKRNYLATLADQRRDLGASGL